MFTDFGTLRFTFYELVTANEASSSIIIFLLLAGAKTLHRSIRSENRHDLCFPHDERVKKLGQRVFTDFYNNPLVKVIKFRGEDSCCCTHFVLLSVSGVLHHAIGRLKDKLKVRIDDEWRLGKILVLVEFYLRLFGAWYW